MTRERSFRELLEDQSWRTELTRPAATWTESLAFRLTNGPHAVAVTFSANGLLHVHYQAAGFQVRQVCTVDWLVDRLIGPAASERAGLLREAR